ncbi:MAG: hypothetical protein EOP09_02265 [Proteobacteria bacterium]|nr:MAG: hypothetical protein EOP09_02265 [Pseudomonadota bacterium]
MCYSAMVKQDIKRLGLSYRARLQLDMFEGLFQERLDGAAAKIDFIWARLRELELERREISRFLKYGTRRA